MALVNNLHLVLNEAPAPTRELKEARALVQSNIVKNVYIAALHNDGFELEKIYGDNILLKRFQLKSRNLSKNFLVQAFKFIEFSYRVYSFYKNQNIKLINIHSVKSLPLGVILKFLYKAKLVYDTHELETETMGLKGFRKIVMKFIERAFIKKADLIFVVSESISEWYAKAYNIRKPTVILNSRPIIELKANDLFREKFGISKNSKIVIYQGGLMKGRGVELIVEAFKSREGSDIVAVFMGYGELEEYVKDASKKCKNIYFHPAVLPDEVLNYTVCADFGILVPAGQESLSYYYCMPNKFFEYTMAGLPVIVSQAYEMEKNIVKYNMGFVVSEPNIKNINDVIDKICTIDVSSMKINARQFALDTSWEKQEQKMLNEYKKLRLETK